MRESIIIPNTDLLSNGEEYYRKLSKEESHAKAILEYSNKHNLNINFETLHTNTFCDEIWYKSIAKIGHVFVRIEDTVLVYLPEELSINQIKWFSNHKNFFVKKRSTLGFSVLDKNGKVVLSRSPSLGENVKSKSYAVKLMYTFIKDNAKKYALESDDLKL